MTNEEAKKKWCPMVRFQIGHNDATWQGRAYSNRAESFAPENCRCIADECALWVKSEVEVNHGWCGLTQAWR